MSDLDARLDLAKSLFGGSSSQSTNTIKGTVMADSSSGTVSVKIGEVEYDEDGNIIVPESELIATIPIIGSASTGDEVTVIVEDGSPTAIAAPGWGDEINDKTQHITFEPSGTYAGLHIHEDASSYNIDSDLWLRSGIIKFRDSGTELAYMSPTGIHLLTDITLRTDEDSTNFYDFIGWNDSRFGTPASDQGIVIQRLKSGTPPDTIVKLKGYNIDISTWGPSTYAQNFTRDGQPFFRWTQLAQTTGTTAKSIVLENTNGAIYSEVMIVADITRNGVLHTFANSFPIQVFGNSAHEYKIGGYVGTSGTSGGAWCSMSLTSFAGANACINGTSFINSTDWTVYAR